VTFLYKLVNGVTRRSFGLNGTPTRPVGCMWSVPVYSEGWYQPSDPENSAFL
jgi:hypothetical protein